jgi:hypothetical protein
MSFHANNKQVSGLNDDCKHMETEQQQNNGSHDMFQKMQEMLQAQMQSQTIYFQQLFHEMMKSKLNDNNQESASSSSSSTISSKLPAPTTSAAASLQPSTQAFKIPTDLDPASKYARTVDYLDYCLVNANIRKVPSSSYIDVVYINAPPSSRLGRFIDNYIIIKPSDPKAIRDKKAVYTNNWDLIYEKLQREYFPSDGNTNTKEGFLSFKWNMEEEAQSNKICYELLVAKASLDLNDKLIIYMFSRQIPVLLRNQIINSRKLKTSINDVEQFDVLFDALIEAEQQLKEIYTNEYQTKLLEGGIGINDPASTALSSSSSSIETAFYTSFGKFGTNNSKKNNNNGFVPYITSTQDVKNNKVMLEFAKKPRALCPYIICGKCSRKNCEYSHSAYELFKLLAAVYGTKIYGNLKSLASAYGKIRGGKDGTSGVGPTGEGLGSGGGSGGDRE